MIKVDKKTITLDGAKTTIMAESVVLLKALKETLSEEEYERILETAELSSEEIRAKSVQTTLEVLGMLFGSKFKEDK